VLSLGPIILTRGVYYEFKGQNKATEEQIEALIQKYSTQESVLRILYTGNVNTLLVLESVLEKGATLKRLAGGGHLNHVTLPECRGGYYLCNDMYSFKMHMDIVRKILDNFINNNPQYFTHNERPFKYAVSAQFVVDVLLHNKDKEFDYLEFTSILPYITNQEIFEQIANIFYLPYAEGETLEQVKRRYWKKKKPFVVTSNSIQNKTENNHILLGITEIQSVDIGVLLKEMKLYYDTQLQSYHTVAYCTYVPDNLKELFPLCKLETFQSIYNSYRDFKLPFDKKESIENDKENNIFPRYSIVDCQFMPPLWGYRKIFEKFVSERAQRFIIFVNYHNKEAFYGSGGKGHILFSRKIMSSNDTMKQGTL
jgi:hypothetical protein